MFPNFNIFEFKIMKLKQILLLVQPQLSSLAQSKNQVTGASVLLVPLCPRHCFKGPCTNYVSIFLPILHQVSTLVSNR